MFSSLFSRLFAGHTRERLAVCTATDGYVVARVRYHPVRPTEHEFTRVQFSELSAAIAYMRAIQNQHTEQRQQWCKYR